MTSQIDCLNGCGSPRISVIQSGVSFLDYDSITNQKGRTCSGGLLKMWSERGATLFFQAFYLGLASTS